MGAAAGAAALGGCAAPGGGAGGKKYAGKKIRMLSQGGGSYEKAVTQYGKEFEELTGCKVEFDWAPWENLMPKLQADLASGSPQLDIFCNDREFQYTVWPDLLPLDDLIKKYNYDMNGFLEPVYKFGQGIAGQKARFGLPLAPGVSVIFYRTDLIKEFPTKWADYEQLLVDMKAKTGKAPLGFAGVAAQLVKAFWARYWSLGQPNLSKDWKVLINNETGVKAATMLYDFYKKYTPQGMLAWDNPDGCNAFKAGDIVVLESWPGFCLDSFEAADSPVKGKWSMARYPEGGSGNYVEHNMVILKKSKNPDAAFEFIAYCTDLTRSKRSAIEFKVDPARTAVYDDNDVKSKSPWMPAYKNVLNAGLVPFFGIPYWLEMFIALAEGLSTILAEKAKVKEALDAVAAKWEKLIKDNPLNFEYTELPGK
jgi:multiple sugar transport system substrate-binding protein